MSPRAAEGTPVRLASGRHVHKTDRGFDSTAQLAMQSMQSVLSSRGGRGFVPSARGYRIGWRKKQPGRLFILVAGCLGTPRLRGSITTVPDEPEGGCAGVGDNEFHGVEISAPARSVDSIVRSRA